MRVRVDRERCTGHGRCYVLAPEVYEDDEYGRCRIPRERVARELEPKARLGAENCPEHAITLED